jgi:hypothetical protein
MCKVQFSANSRKFIESWKSKVSNAENRSEAKNIAKPQKPEQTQLRETHDHATQGWPKLGLNLGKTVFSSLKFSLVLV